MPTSAGISPGIQDRWQRLRQWLAGEAEQLHRFLDPRVEPRLYSLATVVLERIPRVGPWLLGPLESAMRIRVPLQPCIRDLWSDHVLYSGDQVTGLVDFGSMHVDNVATDVARLLGSMIQDDLAGWQAGIVAYQSVRPLSAAERKLIEAFDRSTVVMAGLNWIDWIYRQRRVFADVPAIRARLAEIVQRLDVVQAPHPVWLGPLEP